MSKLARACLYFIEQPRVFDGNYRLVCEGRNQFDLFGGERGHGAARQHKHPNERSFTQERYAQDGAISANLLDANHPVFGIGFCIENMNWGAFKQHTPDRTLPSGFPRRAFHALLESRRKSIGRLGVEKTVAFRTSKISEVGLA